MQRVHTSFFCKPFTGLRHGKFLKRSTNSIRFKCGSLIHEIQFELFERLSEAKLLPVRRQNLERVGVMLDDVIGQVARQFYSDLAPAIDRVWDRRNRCNPS
jgi:hypothetical protein